MKLLKPIMGQPGQITDRSSEVRPQEAFKNAGPNQFLNPAALPVNESTSPVHTAS